MEARHPARGSNVRQIDSPKLCSMVLKIGEAGQVGQVAMVDVLHAIVGVLLQTQRQCCRAVEVVGRRRRPRVIQR